MHTSIELGVNALLTAAQTRGTKIALVGVTTPHLRVQVIEARGGLIQQAEESAMSFEWLPSANRVKFSNGSRIDLYAAGDLLPLRGAQFHYAWGVDFNEWRKPNKTIEQLRISTRLGNNPQVLVTV